jgi:hypothetical protein
MKDDNDRQVTLGSAEKAVLLAMLQRRDVWSKASGWVWESAHWTVQLMGALERKGLVQPLVPDEQYQLTARGKGVATELLLPFVQIHEQKRTRPVSLPPTGSYRVVKGRRGVGR